MQELVPGFMKFVTRPMYGLILRILGCCFFVVGLIAAGLDAAWAGFTPVVWFLLALICFLGVICNLLAQLICHKKADKHGAAEWHASRHERVAPAVAAEAPKAETAKPEPAAPAAKAEMPAKAPSLEIEVFCVKCRDKRMVKDPVKVTLKNGRPAYQGACPVCGTKVMRILKAE